MRLQHTVHATIREGEESGYVAECYELNAVTQGATLDEIARNLREAVALAVQGEDLDEIGIAQAPVIIATLELEPSVASSARDGWRDVHW